MTRVSHEDVAALVGIDWADAAHAGCLQAAGAAKRERLTLEHTPEAIAAWVPTLRTRFDGQPIAVCLALHQGPFVSALRQDDLLVLCPLNPRPLARDREVCTPSRATDDPTDAALQRALLRTHRDTRQPLQPQSPTMRARAQLVEHRRRVVNDTVRITTRLTSTLKHYFPQVLPWCQDTDPPLFGDCLSRWPTLKAAQLARRSPRATFFRDHHVRSADVVAPRLHALKAASPWTTDEGVIAPHALLVQALGNQLRVPLAALETFAKAIAQRAQRHPDFPLFQALPGAGPSSPPGCSSPLAHNANARPPPPNCKNMRGSHPSPNAAARSPGGTGAFSVQRSAGTRASSGPPNRSGIPSGRGSLTSSNATRARPITPPSGHWRSHGSASCLGAGRSARRTMRPSISRRFSAGAHR